MVAHNFFIGERWVKRNFKSRCPWEHCECDINIVLLDFTLDRLKIQYVDSVFLVWYVVSYNFIKLNNVLISIN